MADKSLAHQTFGLSGRALCLALFGKYLGLMIYGVWAAVVEIPTFTLVGSSTFATVWAGLVALLAFAAAVGVTRTWATGKYRVEQWSTALFIAVFTGYSYALVYRAWSTADWGAAPLALIPVILCILPTIRWFSLSVHGRNLRFTNEGEPAL